MKRVCGLSKERWWSAEHGFGEFYHNCVVDADAALLAPIGGAAAAGGGRSSRSRMYVEQAEVASAGHPAALIAMPHEPALCSCAPSLD